ncbi:hypothetical protein [Pseudooceanicola algae]|uniref:Outer membrane protein beta-barrel domain-containing protein n=1 Tax=Pseudooceanicola algae TaxID=1537215 RepID=A0A418SC09_9RHOB|nr:hypothetical protein [Pseudooceanicola algae]QPM89940.1 hypothetical protein PSAL_011700 [Pseudooceanicola algae]
MTVLTSRRLAACACLVLLTGPLGAAAQEKLDDDPTKVATKMGVKYTDEFSVSGSLAFGPVTKINAQVSESGHWQFGGSYLFSFGIVNVNAGRDDLDNGVSQVHYAIGSFLPLSALGLQTGSWQLFTAFGYNYTDSDVPVYDYTLNDMITMPVTNSSGYLGLMALKPISTKVTLQGGLIAIRGTDDYSGLGGGIGATYQVTDRDGITLSGSYFDNSYGTKDQVAISYRHEF